MEIKLSLTEEIRPFKHSPFRQLLHDSKVGRSKPPPVLTSGFNRL